MRHRSETATTNDTRGMNWLRGTAPKVFFIMVLALMPLAVGGLISNWKSISSAEQEKVELMTVAAQQNADRLASDINTIRTTQALTANVLARDSDPGNICERMQRLFKTLAGENGIESVIFDARGQSVCKAPGATQLLAQIRNSDLGEGDLALAPELDGILLKSSSRDGSLTTFALYRRTALERLASGSALDPHQAVYLRQADKRLVLAGQIPKEVQASDTIVARAPIGETGLAFVLSVTGRDYSARTISLLMPILIWLSAAFLSWLVVRWVLIEPLMALRGEVATYVPGGVIVPPRLPRLASSEIAELGKAFREMSEDVAEHEGEMRTTLERQTQLTREVHHRVKNNLQIISSLISLHWRAAQNESAGNAHLSIQRRVDALAVVQRNHYAELDAERGVRARPTMSEIASSLKTSAQVQSNRNLDIAVDCDDVYLHQDVAAPLAFMTAELADLVIALEDEQKLDISLVRVPGRTDQARFALASPAFRRAHSKGNGQVALYERVLGGLARQLRTTLEHDAKRGEYHVVVPLSR
ncbi:MAG: sensor histidine kinase [Sphingobium sp.]